MAEYLIQDTTLNNLGDSIRDLNDTTSTMTPAQMISTVDDAVDEIESQTALIAQCLSALEGKVAGGDGGTVETCTVNVMAHDDNGTGIVYICYTSLSTDGTIQSVYQTFDNDLSVTLTGVVKNTIVTVQYGKLIYICATGTIDDKLLYKDSNALCHVVAADGVWIRNYFPMN